MKISNFFGKLNELINATAAALLMVFVLPVSIAFGQNGLDNEGSVPTSAQPIGSVTLVIGRAILSSSISGVVQVDRGQILREGDKIATESNGHVHIKFKDNAVLSVRPRSELQILAYQFDEREPENSQVKCKSRRRK